MPIHVELQLDNGEFTTRMLHAGDTVQRFEQQLGHAVVGINRIDQESKGLLSTLRDFSVTISAAIFAFEKLKDITVGIAGDLIKTNAEMERLTMLMKNMSTAADPVKDAADNVKYLRDMAKDAPFSLKAMTETFTQMKVAGIDPMGGMFKNLIDGIAAMGGSDEILKRASLALTQMAGKSVIQMEELRRQLGEAVPNAVQIMARSMGTSIAGLNQAVGSGALDAKKALQQFSDELERSFGGSRHQMMTTFTGQIQQMTTNFQTLQLKIGEKGFFDGIKKQLSDLNSFMDSNMAERMAGAIGGGMSTALSGVRAVVDKVIELRFELMGIAEAFLFAFAGKAAIQGIEGLVGWFGRLRENVQKFRNDIDIARTEMARTQALFSVLNATGGANIFDRLSYGAQQLVPALGLVARGFASVAPYLPIIIGGASILIEYFDVFGTKAKKATDELERFGAVSRDQVALVKGRLQSVKDEIAALQDEKDNVGYDTLQAMGRPDTDKRLAELRAQQIILEGLIAKGEKQLDASEAKQSARQATEKLENDIAKVRLEYRLKADVDSEQQKKDRAAAQERGNESLQEVEKKYGRIRLEAARDLNDKITTLIQESIDRQKELYNHGTTQEKDAAAVALLNLYDQQKQKKEEADRLNEQVALTVPEADKPFNEKTAFKKGQENLEKLKAEVAGLKEALHGGNAEVAELGHLLDEAHKYGFKNVDAVQKLIDKTLELKQAATDYNEVVNSKKKLDTDIDSLIARFRVEQVEAQTRGMSEADKLRVKMASGVYPGLGGDKQTDAQKRILKELQDSTTETDRIAKSLGDTWVEKTFGVKAQDAANMMKQTLQSIAFSMGIIKDKSDFTIDGKVKPGASGGGAPGSTRTVEEMGFKDERELAIRTLVGEAGNQIDEGIKAVAYVMKNRLGAGTFGKDLSEVITAPKQFSVWNPGDPAGDVARKVKIGSPEWNRVAAIWDAVASGAAEDPTHGAVNYANVSTAKPHDWFSQLDQKIQDHTFGNRVGTYQGPVYINDSKLKNPEGTPPDTADKLNTLDTEEQKAHRDKIVADYKDLITRTQNEIAALKERGENFDKFQAEARSKIRSGDSINPSDKNPDSDFWKEYMKTLQMKDAQEKDTEEANRKRREGRAAADALEKEHAKDVEEAEANSLMLRDKNQTKFTESYIRQIAQRRHQLEQVEANPDATDEDKTRARYRVTQAEDDLRAQDIEKNAIKYQQENRQLAESLMSEGEMRTAAFNRQMELLNAEEDAYKASGERDVNVTRIYEERKDLERRKYTSSGALTQQMKGFADVGNNLEKAMTSWIGSFNDNLATALLHGKANWKSFAETILKDLTKIGLQLAESVLFKLFLNAGGSGILSGLEGLGGAFGKAHTGGIIGHDSLATSFVNPMVFAGAPRFHTGGMIGHDEVPIIARKGEGVFTAEQMKALPGLYGSRQGDVHVNINAPVHANGGSPEQNADLAKQVSQGIEASVRATIVDEIRKQQRPGNLLNR